MKLFRLRSHGTINHTEAADNEGIPSASTEEDKPKKRRCRRVDQAGYTVGSGGREKVEGFYTPRVRGYGDKQMGRILSWTYRRALTDREWGRLLAEARRIVAQAEQGLYTEASTLRRGKPILLAGPRGTFWPLFEHQVIALNGKKPDHYGSFVLFKGPTGRRAASQEHGECSGCCETGGQPYDAVVVAVLAAARAIAPGAIEVCCKNGNLADHRENIG